MWSAHVAETPAAEIDAAIDACETQPAPIAEQALNAREQINTAKRLAHELVASGVVAGTSFEIVMGGHADPGDRSTQGDYVHLQVTERPGRETIHEVAEREATEAELAAQTPAPLEG